MKLKVEKCEEVVVIRADGEVGDREAKVLGVGLPKMTAGCKLMILSFQGAMIPAALVPSLVSLKQNLAKTPGMKLAVVSPAAGLGDFPTLEAVLSALPGTLGQVLAYKINMENVRDEILGKIAKIESKFKTYEGKNLSIEKIEQEKEFLEMQVNALKKSIEGLVNRLTAQKAQTFTEEEKKTAPTQKDLSRAHSDLGEQLKNKGIVIG